MKNSAPHRWRSQARRRADGPCWISGTVIGAWVSSTSAPTERATPLGARRQDRGHAAGADTGGQGGELGTADQSQQDRLLHLDAADTLFLDGDRAGGEEARGQVQRAGLAGQAHVPPLDDVAGDGDHHPAEEPADDQPADDEQERELVHPGPRRLGGVRDRQLVAELRERTHAGGDHDEAGEAERREPEPRPVDLGEHARGLVPGYAAGRSSPVGAGGRRLTGRSRQCRTSRAWRAGTTAGPSPPWPSPS